jgi:competence protein ComEC
MRPPRLIRPRALADVLRPGLGLGDRGALSLAAAHGWLVTNLAREHDYRSGFIWLPVAFGLGILAYFAAAEEPGLWAGPALALIAFAGMLRAEGIPRFLCLSLAMAASGFAAGAFRTALVASPMLDRDLLVEVKGFIETVDDYPGRQRMILRPTAMEGITEAALPFRIRIGAPGRSGPKPGDFAVLKARLAPPSEAALPGGYDFRRESFFRSTGGVGYAVGPVKTEAPPGLAPLTLRINAAIDRWRNALTDRIARAIGGDAGALSAALITGKRGLISEPANDDLRGAGLYHVVSISGLHMVLAAGVLFWSIRALLAAIPAIALRYPIKKYAAGAAMVGATFYCIFSGSEVATERSLIMTLVMLGAILVDRPALAMRNLALSALIVMAREPESLLGPSFQMSFAAVACLIGANQVWRTWKAGRPAPRHGRLEGFARKLLLSFLGIAATTIVATLATAPFSAYHFHRLNPYGIIGNSLGIPMVSLVVMPAAVAGTLLVPFGLDGIVWTIMGHGVSGMLMVAQRVAAIENASVTAPDMQGLGFGLLVAALILFVGLKTRLRWLALAPLGLWLLLLRTPDLPDVVVDPTGKMALIRGPDDRYHVMAVGSASKFTLAQWLPALGDNRSATDPSLKEGVRCDKSGCITRLRDGRQIALVIRPDALREDCTRADLVMTPLAPIAACTRTRLLARDHFSRYGATRIFSPTAADWRIETTLDPATERPWRRISRAAPLQPTVVPSAQGPSAAIAPAQGQPKNHLSRKRPEPAPRLPETLEDDPGLTPRDQ